MAGWKYCTFSCRQVSLVYYSCFLVCLSVRLSVRTSRRPSAFVCSQSEAAAADNRRNSDSDSNRTARNRKTRPEDGDPEGRVDRGGEQRELAGRSQQ